MLATLTVGDYKKVSAPAQVGTHTITAVYSGDGFLYAGSTSAPITIVVVPNG
jgi:hypothetical protein